MDDLSSLVYSVDQECALEHLIQKLIDSQTHQMLIECLNEDAGRGSLVAARRLLECCGCRFGRRNESLEDYNVLYAALGGPLQLLFGVVLQCINHRRSKSSNLSLYLSTFLLILLLSTHVTKSSMFLVTMNAGSVTTSGPTLT